MTQITLTDQQLEYATAMGQQRHRYDQAVGASGSYNINESDNDDPRLDIQGCIAEYAVSLALGRGVGWLCYRLSKPPSRCWFQHSGSQHISSTW